jgi:hypothetical protein
VANRPSVNKGNCHVQEKCRLRSPNGARFCRNLRECAATGRRRDVSHATPPPPRYVYTPKEHCQRSVGRCFAATVHEPPPVPRSAQKCHLFSWTRSTACLSAQPACQNCPAVTDFRLVCTVLGSQPIGAQETDRGNVRSCPSPVHLANARGLHSCGRSHGQIRAAIRWLPSTPPRYVNLRRACTADRPCGRYGTSCIGPVLEVASHGTRRGVTGERWRIKVPTSAGSVPWVSIAIVEAAASREQRCRAFPPSYLLGDWGRDPAAVSAQFRSPDCLPVPT